MMPSFALGCSAWRPLRGSRAPRCSTSCRKITCARPAPAACARWTAAVARHLARNASIPVITVAALEISNLLAGAVIVETVFAWPGLGQVTVQSILARDFLDRAGRGAARRVRHHGSQSRGRSSLQRRRSAHPARGVADDSGRRADGTRAAPRPPTTPRWWSRRHHRLVCSGGDLRAADRTLRSEQRRICSAG